ncbi:MAG: ribonuclease J [Patescibacteria group bacterium]|nr:ribonuclease J [Patescibacteria group bacterium]
MYKQKKQFNNQFNNIRIIPLGGLGEVGRNMTLLEYKSKILIIDMGFRMPGEDMPGIDFIIPDISYLKLRTKDIVGVVFTHGHYDHIGAVPYYMDKLGNPPMFASALTKGIILRRQTDYPNQPKLDITTIKNKTKITLNPFKIEFFRMNHNIPDNMGLFIETPAGNILHTSDFKFDHSPVNDLPTDIEYLKEISRRKITLLMSDSTGAEEEGHSLSEAEIQKNLEKIFIKSQNRIIAATFSSLINRVQQLISLSEKYNRKVALGGYSMETNVEIARNLGYIKAKKGTIIKMNEVKKYPDDKITFICTGAQGEERATLVKIANKEHRHISFKKGDTVIFSSSVIPGNERSVQNLKDDILRQGVRVFHYKMMDIHAGGHAQRQELKQMIRIARPKFFMPIHGQYSMLVNHAELARFMGIPEKNIVVAENGQIININQNRIIFENKTIPSKNIMVDGLGVGDIGEIVLKDRNMLGKDGMFVIIAVIDKKTKKIISSPDIISRGFVYLRESKPLLAETRKQVKNLIDNGFDSIPDIKEKIKNEIENLLFKKTRRHPIVLPVVIEV